MSQNVTVEVGTGHLEVLQRFYQSENNSMEIKSILDSRARFLPFGMLNMCFSQAFFIFLLYTVAIAFDFVC